jgi:hypothetical protein
MLPRLLMLLVLLPRLWQELLLWLCRCLLMALFVLLWLA